MNQIRILTITCILFMMYSCHDLTFEEEVIILNDQLNIVKDPDLGKERCEIVLERMRLTGELPSPNCKCVYNDQEQVWEIIIIEDIIINLIP